MKRDRLPSRTGPARLRKAVMAKQAERYAAARAIVETGMCPQCGAKLRRNLSMAGWWQCSQLGAVGFRADATKDSCDFQTFTE